MSNEQTWSWHYEPISREFRICNTRKPGEYPPFKATKREAIAFRITQVEKELEDLRGLLAENEPEVIVCAHPYELYEPENGDGYMCGDCGAEFWSLTNVYPIARVKE